MRKLSVLILAGCAIWATSPVQGRAPVSQDEAVRELRAFLNLKGSQLYLGRDALGNCRVFAYPAGNPHSQEIWIEGTFQRNDGPVAGIAIPFMLSASPEKMRLEDLSTSSGEMSLYGAFPSSRGTIKMAIRLTLDHQGRLAEAAYATSSGTRICSALRRTL